MVTTTSAARRTSSLHRLGCSVVMSMPTSRIASTATRLICSAGSEPPDQATARPAARWLNQPSAICDRPALCTQRNSTAGSASSGDALMRLHHLLGVHVGIEEPGDADGEHAARELGGDERGC